MRIHVQLSPVSMVGSARYCCLTSHALLIRITVFIMCLPYYFPIFLFPFSCSFYALLIWIAGLFLYMMFLPSYYFPVSFMCPSFLFPFLVCLMHCWLGLLVFMMLLSSYYFSISFMCPFFLFPFLVLFLCFYFGLTLVLFIHPTMIYSDDVITF